MARTFALKSGGTRSSSPLGRHTSAMAILTALGCAAATTVVFAAAAQAQGFFSSGEAPRFSADQAARGKTVYAANCLSCHGGNLDDGQFGPALKGGAFKADWTAKPPEALQAFIQTSMPPSEPGGLADGDYADVTAYILQANGVRTIGTGKALGTPGVGKLAKRGPCVAGGEIVRRAERDLLA